MLTQIINGRILTPQGWLKDGSVLICDGKILEVTNSDLAVIGATVIDARGMTIVPGFVSMHAHGGGGHDFTEATEEAFRMATTAHLKHGATSMFPTLSSTSFEKLYQAVDVCEGLMQEPDSPILGLHIEGPYLNPKMAGSQYEGFLLMRMNIFRYWNILLVSSVGISARNYVERMISPNIPVQRE